MARFTFITLTLVALLAIGLWQGGLWPWVALSFVTVFTYMMDRLIGPGASPAPGQEFPAGDALAVSLAVAHLVLLAAGVWTIAGGHLTGVSAVAAFIGLGLFFGQVSNANAHELVHRSNRWLRRLGVTVYVSLLFGHHASAHIRVHHVNVATAADPNSARAGESYYRFATRAWVGSFRAGLRAETALRARAASPALLHPYAVYLGGAGAVLIVAFLLAGFTGVLVLCGLAAHAQMQLLLSDYVQHYGLRRHQRADGRTEPVGPQHSWNAPQWFSSALVLNATRHSDHHQRPATPYPALDLRPASMPILPRSLPVMAMLALWPPLWRRVMDPQVAKWDAKNRQGAAV
ncbi:alkane 1-monooxygenase [Primorskyibacter marinus]|uniref:alkane 1-monooxygenase n=1 Tax=Primorskyibacter marinus TaxID=1977320 RepID=UPI000E3061D3|nr:alkane 1-monooxygenase [Primorskyibacter marinus]